MSIVRATWTVAIMLATSLVITQPAQAQVGGLLRRAKQKAAEKVAEKVTEKAQDAARGSDTTARRGSDSAASRPGSGGAATLASPATPAASAPRGGANFRREKPLDPTVLETPGHASGVQGQQPAWHGSAMTADAFKSSIPEITEARFTAYLRARAAITDEALRLNALAQSTAGMRELRRYMGPTLAQDELPPMPGYMKVWPMAGPKHVERHLDSVLEQALGGAMTRMQFYQLHEMVEMFLTGQVNVPGMSTGVQGRRLSDAEIALLKNHRAALDALREKQRQLR